MSDSTSSSVDPAEVDYYTRLAETWWDPQGPFWPLHGLNKLRQAWIRDQAAHWFGRSPSADQPLAGLRALDIGCGGGLLSEAMAGLGAEVLGIDVTAKNITVAERHAAESGQPVTYRHTTAEELSAESARFDIVLNMEVVEHVADLAGFLRATGGLVDDGGVVFLATINRTPLSWLFAIVGAEYILRWLPRGTHRWDRFRTPQELCDHMGEQGFREVAGTGVRVSPITRRFGLTPLKAVNYMLMMARSTSQQGNAVAGPKV